MGVEHAQHCFLLFPFSRVLCATDSGCDSVTDTETEDEKVLPYSEQHSLPSKTSPGSLMVVQPDRIRCGVGTAGAGGWMLEHGLWGFSVEVCCSKGSGVLLLHLTIIPAFLWGFPVH